MTFVEIYKALKLVPETRRHIIQVKKSLNQQSYQKASQLDYAQGSQESLLVIVKSYFWACRLIKNCQCLPRSVALFQHLKASGYKVSHCFGINKQGNQTNAHAWVEYGGTPLNESPDLKKRFTILQ